MPCGLPGAFIHPFVFAMPGRQKKNQTWLYNFWWSIRCVWLGGSQIVEAWPELILWLLKEKYAMLGLVILYFSVCSVLIFVNSLKILFILNDLLIIIVFLSKSAAFILSNCKFYFFQFCCNFFSALCKSCLKDASNVFDFQCFMLQQRFTF